VILTLMMVLLANKSRVMLSLREKAFYASGLQEL